MRAAPVVRIEPRGTRELEPRIDEALLDAHDNAGIHITGTGAALHAVAHAVAESGEGPGLLERERAVGAQQHHAFGKTLADTGEMVLLVIEQLHGEPLPIDTRQHGFQHRFSRIDCSSPLTIQQTSRLFLAERGSVGHFDAICLL